jgi:hypothetical protein
MRNEKRSKIEEKAKMPLAGKGMLLTSMDIDAANEAEFNRWYDREHLEERVAIEGFLEARRYVAHEAQPKYLSLYSTETFEVLDSTAYRTALANQTKWSQENISRFKNMIRAVARITFSRGQGRGAALGIIRLRPTAGGEGKLRDILHERLDPTRLDGVISMHVLESDPRLSKSLTEDASRPNPGGSDWFVLTEATDVRAVPQAAALVNDNAALKPLVISSGIYRLLWDLAKGEIPTV